MSEKKHQFDPCSFNIIGEARMEFNDNFRFLNNFLHINILVAMVTSFKVILDFCQFFLFFMSHHFEWYVIMIGYSQYNFISVSLKIGNNFYEIQRYWVRNAVLKGLNLCSTWMWTEYTIFIQEWLVLWRIWPNPIGWRVE